MNAWVQPYKPGSDLHHPIFNPKSPKGTGKLGKFAGIVVRQSSSRNTSKFQSPPPIHDKATEDEELVSTKKGKERAVSPRADKTELKVHSLKHESKAKQKKNGLATTVARRTIDKDSDSSHDEMSEVDNVNEDDDWYCNECNRQLDTAIAFKRHMKDPSVHQNLQQCEVCQEKYWSLQALRAHRKDTKHGLNTSDSGGGTVTGRFTSQEEQKVERWRREFCVEYNISKETFNDLMTAAREKDLKKWNSGLITQAEFIEEFLGVLPYRQRQSMIRFGERKYNNVDQSEWTQEDDNEILRLIAEGGPQSSKWKDIGKRLGRSGESCRMRYKNYLRLRESGNRGTWTKAEDELFKRAVDEVQEASVTADDKDFTWEAVSAKVGTRTPQQCANHYRAQNGAKVGGRWVHGGLANVSTSAKRSKSSPSKMDRRLSGTISSRPKAASRLSEMYITLSDDDSEEEYQKEAQSSHRSKLSTRESENEEEQLDKPPEDDSSTSDRGEDADSDDGSLSGSSKSQGDEAMTPYNQDEESSHSSQQDDEEPPAIQPKWQNPFNARTPGKTMSTSQLFKQTQANTSAPRQPASSRLGLASQERPSPNIPIRHQPERSPAIKEDEDEALLDEEAEETSAGSSQSTEETPVSSSGSESEDSSESESSENGKRGKLSSRMSSQKTQTLGGFWDSIKSSTKKKQKQPPRGKRISYPEGSGSSNTDDESKEPKLPKVRR